MALSCTFFEAIERLDIELYFNRLSVFQVNRDIRYNFQTFRSKNTLNFFTVFFTYTCYQGANSFYFQNCLLRQSSLGSFLLFFGYFGLRKYSGIVSSYFFILCDIPQVLVGLNTLFPNDTLNYSYLQLKYVQECVCVCICGCICFQVKS